jgi:hypothetical protein
MFHAWFNRTGGCGEVLSDCRFSGCVKGTWGVVTSRSVTRGRYGFVYSTNNAIHSAKYNRAAVSFSKWPCQFWQYRIVK